MKRGNRALAVLLSLVITLTYMPTLAFAGTEGVEPGSEEAYEQQLQNDETPSQGGTTDPADEIDNSGGTDLPAGDQSGGGASDGQDPPEQPALLGSGNTGGTEPTRGDDSGEETLAPIKYYNTWQVPNVFYFDDEDPVPSRTTQGTVPTIKREGESSYHAPEDFVTVSWKVTDSTANSADEAASSIATVDENGLVTFNEPGTVKVWLVKVREPVTVTSCLGILSGISLHPENVYPSFSGAGSGVMYSPSSNVYDLYNTSLR